MLRTSFAHQVAHNPEMDYGSGMATERQIEAANFARRVSRRKKQRRWAAEMQQDGWGGVTEPDDEVKRYLDSK